MNTENRPVANLFPERESLGFLVADATRLIRRVCALYLDEHQITVAQMRALAYVARNEGIRQVELADLLDVQPITLARSIDQLADLGFVERRAHPQDRRAFQLFLTPAAIPVLQVLSERGKEFQGKALAGLTQEQKDVLFLGLNKVRDNLAALLR